MKIDHYINNRIAAAWMLLLSLFLLPACSNEEDGPVVEPEAQYATMVISLGALDNSTPAYTRAETIDPDVEEVDEYERYIKYWWIVVLDKDNKVDRVITNDPVSQNPAPDSETKVEMELPIGETYTFYAFANLNDLEDTYISGLSKGNDFLLSKAVSLKSLSSYKIPNEGETASAYIPMSSYGYKITVQEENKPLEIQLIRLIGKVEVSLENKTGEDVVLKSLSLDKFRTEGSIYLLPYDAAKGENTTNLLQEDMQPTYIPSFPSAIGKFSTMTLSTEDITIQESESATFWSYANETSFQDIEGFNYLQVRAVIENRNDQPLDTEFSFIRRNDWLKIPLLLSDVSTTIEFDMKHMPIGGLPATITIPEGLTIPQATFWTQDHGGDITITYTLNSISSLTEAQILHYNKGDKYPDNEQHPFTSAVLESNDDLLISLPTNNSYAPWLDNSAIAFDLSSNTDGGNGSFTITAQELAKSAEARIRLNMVIEGTSNNTKQKVVVPYTIIIKNKKDQDWEQGGN